MTDELQPPVEPEPVAPDVEEDEDEDFELVEPIDAKRLSPYALASFIVALLSAYGLAGVIGSILIFIELPGHASAREIAHAFTPAVAPLVLGVVALWLSGKGEDEIFVADGHFGGVGFCRAGRLLAMVVIVVVVATTVLALVIGPQRPFRVV